MSTKASLLGQREGERRREEERGGEKRREEERKERGGEKRREEVRRGETSRERRGEERGSAREMNIPALGITAEPIKVLHKHYQGFFSLCE